MYQATVKQTANNVLTLLAAYGFNTEAEYKLEGLRDQNAALCKAVAGAKEAIAYAERTTGKNMWAVFLIVDQLATKRSTKDMDEQIPKALARLQAL